ncbi:STAS domain-containing protein [uncultured Oxalicibacterium sp.]|uniref:STAS domain-containing protein n=1 Tax=uncultured Oxalicibacterium sp. TaxID=1168540 RepID=UPI0025D61607|nr:STAS domain-containing protein [uncultured Oxalicibacterium sp.]
MFQAPADLTFKHARFALEAGLRAIGSGVCGVDLGGVTAVDSSAVAVLLAWQRAAKERGAMLALHNMPSSLDSLLALYDVRPLLQAGAARVDLPHH